MTKIFNVPFALSGDKEAIPDALQPDGSVSFTQGFGFDYERPTTDPLYKPFPRDPYNWLMGAITEALGEIQRQGVATWSADGVPYGLNARVWHDGNVYRSTIAANPSTPGENTDWVDVRALATETRAGVAEIATIAEAQAQVSDAVILTPKKLADAFKAGQVLSGTAINQNFPAGLILKAGLFTGSSGLINFATPFPSFCVGVVGAEANTPSLGQLDYTVFQYRDLTRFSFSPEVRRRDGTYPPVVAIRWIAAGF